MKQPTMPTRPLCPIKPGQKPAKYTNAAATDIRATFAKFARLQGLQQAKERAQ